MSRASRDTRRVHAGSRDDVRFERASTQASAVTTFLQEQDVRPAPRAADIEAFLGRSDAALYLALRDNRIIGTLGCVVEAAVLRLTHFSVARPWAEQVAPALIALAEGHARSVNTTTIAASAQAGSPAEQALCACGFAADWEEGDVADGRVVNVVDLVKAL